MVEHSEVELLRPLRDRLLPVECPVCGELMVQAIARPVVRCWPPAGTPRADRRAGGGLNMKYICDGGKTFYSRGELREYCKRNNLAAEVLS